MDTESIIDSAVSILANTFEVAGTIAAAIIFLTPTEKIESCSRSIDRAAKWASNTPWIDWLHLSTAHLSGFLRKIYGNETNHSKTIFREPLIKPGQTAMPLA